jgi:hypothetical protein
LQLTRHRTPAHDTWNLRIFLPNVKIFQDIIGDLFRP